jgi:subtilisin-like proprotein convertase family protein
MPGPRYWLPTQVFRLVLILLILYGLLPAPAQALPVAATENGLQSAANSSAIVPALAANATSNTASFHKVIVNTEDQATLAQIAASGATLLEDYGSFSLWRVNDTQVSRLAKLDKVETRDDLDEIGLRNGAINTLKGANPVPATLSQVKSSGNQMWMVQFVGPVKSEWLDDLKASGIELVSYMPNNAYVIWADSPAITKLESVVGSDPNIQWTGAYHPAYRLDPSLQPGSAKISRAADQLVDVTVQFYKTGKVQDSINRLLALGGKVYKRPSDITNLNLLNVSLQVPAGQLVNLANWVDVFNVEPWFTPKLMDEAQGQILAGNLTVSSGKVVPTGPGYLAWLASKGFPTTPSQYPVVDVVDDGIDNGTATPLHPDFYIQGSVSNTDRLVANINCTADPLPNGVAGHGNLNAGIVGAYNDKATAPYTDTNGFNRGVGISPYTRLSGTKIFNNGGGYDVGGCGSTDQGVVQSSFNAGATITSNSWGADNAGAYDASAQAYDALTRDASSTNPGNQQILHVFAAGNAGSNAQTVGTPGTAKNVLTVGATENVRDDGVADGCAYSGAKSADNIATFSSRGPAKDLRVKPEIMAPGTHVQGPASQDPGYNGSGVCGAAGNFSNPHVPGSQYYPGFPAVLTQTLYTWSSGTSHSTPAVAGAASLVYNYYKRVLNPGQNPSPAILKGLLLNTPRYLNGTGTGGTLPSNDQGWGDVNLGPLFDATNHYCVLLDQSVIFTATGQIYSKACQVTSSSKPLNITLVWTDAPGSTTGNAYVNNLDLEVTLNGQTYKGNNFSGQYSVAGGAADVRNNVENIFLPAGTTGKFVITVKASNLAGDAVPGSGSTTDQDFALIAYNADTINAAILTPNGVSLQDAPPNGNNNQNIEPGETISLTMGLQNLGTASATGISSTVQSNTPGITMINNGSTYPDLAPNASANNNTPYSFSVSPGFTCGNPVSFTQSVSYNSGQVFSTTVGFQTGSPFVGAISNVYSSTDVPKAIPDNNAQGVTSTLTIAGVPNPIGKIRVRINANHTFDGDLAFKLISPSGTAISLIARRGSSGDNFVNTVLDDAAATSISTITSGGAPFTGSFRPEQPLAAVNGQSLNGTWSLNVSDNANIDTGTLVSWAILYDSLTYICAPITPVPAASLNVAGYPSPVFPGTTGSFTVTAKDGGGNVAPAYTGTVAFSSTDPGATLPPNYTFQLSDHGVHVFTATLVTTGTQTITATDTINSGIKGSQTGIVVKTLPASIAVFAGTPQSAALNQNFSAPLQVVVKDSGGISVTGAIVTFTAPAGGASGTFSNGSNVISATTDVNGIASSGTFKANGTAGSYVVTATVGGVAGQASFNLTNIVVGCTAFVVSSHTDDGSGLECGTLSYALLQASSGVTISFSLAGSNVISVTAALPPVPAGVNIDGGSCAAGPGVILDGTGTSAATNGLVLSGGSNLRNLKVTHFGGKQVVLNGGGNKLGPCFIAVK